MCSAILFSIDLVNDSRAGHGVKERNKDTICIMWRTTLLGAWDPSLNI